MTMELLLDWKSIGSLLATFMFIRTAIKDFLPPEVYQALKRLFLKLFSSLQSNVSILIEEFDNSYSSSKIYDSVQCYLSSKCFNSAQVLKLSKPKNSKNLTYTMDANQKLEETFEGFKVKWSFHSVEKKTSSNGYTTENRYFELSFHEKYKDKVQSSYIPHVMEVAEIIKFKNRERKLYTNRSTTDDERRLWSSIPFSHPSTFDTVAVHPLLKQEIKDDLMKFVNRREFYNRVGRAWKRGYLLYGPPGTGKTSLIAAIANLLEFDIYDLELTAVTSNTQLRKLLTSTSSKSVIVVEDVDCSLDLSDRKNKKNNAEEEDDKDGERGMMKNREHGNFNRRSFGSTVSLSGVLNFVDGLWSSCVGERLMIFTTNHKEKLDQALLRPGRMDKHINLSYCVIEAFKMLAKNYLDIDKHELMKEVEEVLPLVKMTPADVAEIFMSCEDDADIGTKNVVVEMKKRVFSIHENSLVVELKKEDQPVSLEEMRGDPIAEKQNGEEIETEFQKTLPFVDQNTKER